MIKNIQQLSRNAFLDSCCMFKHIIANIRRKGWYIRKADEKIALEQCIYESVDDLALYPKNLKMSVIAYFWQSLPCWLIGIGFKLLRHEMS